MSNNNVLIHQYAEIFLYFQLEEHITRLREEVDREREERNFFQLERDKVNTFWDITKRQLEETKAIVRNKDREIEDAEERHQVEIKVGKMVEKQNNNIIIS